MALPPRWKRFATGAASCLAVVLAASSLLAQSPTATDVGGSRLMTYVQPEGKTYFALSMAIPPAAFPKRAANAAGIDVAVLFDTSASQVGPYRTDALTALKTLLATLAVQDRVHLLAVDLTAVDLSGGFVAPASPEMQAALEKLKRREPLGSTDMALGLRAAAKTLKSSDRPHCIVYLGDGMSKANLLTSQEFGAVVEELANQRSPVLSYAIGPQRDMHLLAALANHTGGMMYLDAAEATTAQQAGAALAQAAHVPVFWPTQTTLPPSFGEAYPQRTPPLRSDRDSILVGVLEGQTPESLVLRGNFDGAPSDVRLTLATVKSADDLAYLPKLVESVRGDGGRSLPTAGLAGLREVGRLLLTQADSLAKMGARELAGGNLLGAQKLAEAAQQVDPSNPAAGAIQGAVQKAVEKSQPPPSPQPAPPSPNSPTARAKGPR